MLKQLFLFGVVLVLALAGYSWYKARKQTQELAKETLPSLVITTTNPVPGTTLQ